jgi:hypothetical protein
MIYVMLATNFKFQLYDQRLNSLDNFCVDIPAPQLVEYYYLTI